MREAHQAGLRTTATMMYGSVETRRGAHRAPAAAARAAGRDRRLHRVHRLELPARAHRARPATRRPASTTCARWRSPGIVLDNFDNLQASWVTQGGKVGQLSLAFGANDMGSVMIEENVVRAAGASYCMDEVEIVRNIENAGFAAKRRNMHYEVLGDPIFRERAVPRRLALDVAKAEDDDDRIPDELAAYDARTPAARRQRAHQRGDGTITH